MSIIKIIIFIFLLSSVFFALEVLLGRIPTIFLFYTKVILKFPPKLVRRMINILNVVALVSFLTFILATPLNILSKTNPIKYVAIILLAISFIIIQLDELFVKFGRIYLIKNKILKEGDLPPEGKVTKVTNILDSIAFHSLAIIAMSFTAIEAIRLSLGFTGIKQPTIIYGVDALILIYYFKIYPKLGSVYGILLILIYFSISVFK